MLFHQPVLVAEVLEYMNLRQDRGYYCDCTVGGGGHLLAMLEATKKARFIGIDWDSEAIDYVRPLLEEYKGRCQLVTDNFAHLGSILHTLGVETLEGVLFDLGVSYHQLATPERGFSYKHDGALLMRMARENPSVYEKIRNATKHEIITVLRDLGDVRNCVNIGTSLYEQRDRLRTTFDVRRIVEEKTPARYRAKTLPKVFQALRIWVNNELTNLRVGVAEAFQKLECGGRIVVISYHSGEDRIVKTMFRDMRTKHEMTLLTKKVVKPTPQEIEMNPRARSARLRVGEKCVGL